MVALGDIRKCLVALAAEDSALALAFEHRFDEGELAGHALGNLILAGLIEATGDLVLGRARGGPAARGGRRRPAGHGGAGRPQGRVGAGQVAGQVAVSWGPATSRRSRWCPATPQPPPLAIERIAAADQIVIGPGSLFTSVLAAVAVQGIAEAVAQLHGPGRLRLQPAPAAPRDGGFRRGGPRGGPGQAQCHRGRGRV